MIIPQDLDHLDVYSPEELNNLIIQEISKKSPDPQIIHACINAGAALDFKSSWGWKALHHAAYEGHLEIVKTLIQAGAPLEFRDSHDRTALHWAAREGHLEIIHACINAGASLDIKDNQGRTPWDFAPEIIRTKCPELKP